MFKGAATHNIVSKISTFACASNISSKKRWVEPLATVFVPNRSGNSIAGFPKRSNRSKNEPPLQEEKEEASKDVTALTWSNTNAKRQQKDNPSS
ncbi:hypothetical protein AAHH87_00305 [Candidatus Hodgkinia cicadicola]